MEGVRAILVDKDRNPQWNPPTLAEVSPDWIESYYFGPVEQEWEIPSSSSSPSPTDTNNNAADVMTSKY